MVAELDATETTSDVSPGVGNCFAGGVVGNGTTLSGKFPTLLASSSAILGPHAARIEARNFLTSARRLSAWWESAVAEERTREAVSPVWLAACATPEMLWVTSPVYRAVSW